MQDIILNRLLIIAFFMAIVMGRGYIVEVSKHSCTKRALKILYFVYVIVFSGMVIVLFAYIFATSTFGAVGICSIVAIFYVFVVKS